MFGFSGSVFAANTESIKTTVTIKPSLSLNIPTNTILMNLDPSNHNFEEQDLTIKVGTNNFNGYKLYVNTTGTDLINVADNTKTIPNLSSSTSISSSDFSNCTTTNCTNKWGYRLTQDASSSSGNYSNFTSGSIVSQSSTAINEKISTLGFASKIDYKQASGLYQLNLNFKAIPIVTQYYMQDLTTASGLASTVCTEDPTVVIDKRDEQPYLIQRLDDGRCWMLNNLNLDLTDRTIADTLTPDNTNANTIALKSLKEGNRSAGDQYATAGLTYNNWDNSSYSYSQPLVHKSGTCSTATTFPCTYNGNYTNNTVLSTLTPDPSVFGVGYGKIGIYYNFCAVSAGSYCYGNGTNAGVGSGDAIMDICPSSWRLPTGGTSGEYKILYDAIVANYTGSGTAATASDPLSIQSKLSLLFSGAYDGTTTRQGSYGRFISSTYVQPAAMSRLLVQATNVTIANDTYRYDANPARCILSE